MAFAAALACNPPASSEPAPVAPVEAAPPEPTCEEPPLGTLAWLPELPDPARRPDALASAEPRPGVGDRLAESRRRDPTRSAAQPAGPSPDVAARESSVRSDMPAQTCPWVLFEKDGELAVRPLGRGEAAPPHVRAPVPVLPPAGCRPCRWSGVVTPRGRSCSQCARPPTASWPPRPGSAPACRPLRASTSSPPRWCSRPCGSANLALGTARSRAPWALAPRLCGRSLVLLPTPRLPGAGVEEPPPALVRAAGVYAAAGGELLRQDTPSLRTCRSAPPSRSSCPDPRRSPPTPACPSDQPP
ncbi:hypothetical protein [Nannocystis pusilla]|uniref:hypothetical protein n=1 Tax=Nannocystis pusilla TaxID=889268 RepID=UPI003B7D4039